MCLIGGLAAEHCGGTAGLWFVAFFRTYHRVIAGEHNKGAGSNEDIQILTPAQVRPASPLPQYPHPPPPPPPSLTPCCAPQVFTHPQWNPSTINNDIALIKLASPANLGAHVSPVCLAESSDYFAPGSTCVTSGWGLTHHLGMPLAL